MTIFGTLCHDQRDAYAYEMVGYGWSDTERRCDQGNDDKQAGALPVCLRKAAGRTGGLVRPDCDEYPGGVEDRIRGIPAWDIRQVSPSPDRATEACSAERS